MDGSTGQAQVSICVPVMIHRRENVFRLWALAMWDVIEHNPWAKIDVLCVGSEPAARTIALEHGFDYFDAPNQPLGNKAQLRLEAAKEYAADHLLFLGSDDIMPPSTLEVYRPFMEQGIEHIAPLDIFYWVGRSLYHSHGYTHRSNPFRAGEPMAVGRMLSKKFLDRQGWDLWDRSVAKHIDRGAFQRIEKAQPTKHYFKHMERGSMIVDVKTEENLSQFRYRYGTHRRVEHSALDSFTSDVREGLHTI